MDIRRLLFCLLYIIILMVCVAALANPPDLKGADVLAKAPCVHNEKHFLCVAVLLEDDVYVVLLDAKGEYEIYLVTEKESVLIWYRDAV